MRHFSTLAGPLRHGDAVKDGRVKYKSLISYDRLSYRLWARFTAWAAFGLVLIFAGVLFHPTHWLITKQPDSPVHTANLIMLIILMALQVFVIIGTWSSTRATLLAKNPIPMTPQKGLRVAFVTTRAPGEPTDMVRTTLTAATRMYYPHGPLDIWLLDETNDDELKAMCEELGVKHFSRKGVERWNTPKPDKWGLKHIWRLYWHGGKLPDHLKPHTPDPFHAAKTKHGNLNAWGDYVSEQGYIYDIVAGVDTDQVPEPNFLERLIGYFRDPDVAFVVGPQVYGNYRPGLSGLVARWAESQASFFQSTIQRAGNASHSPMFVGTNYAVRTVALDQIKGFQPCITEDMATGIAIHAQKNPDTNQPWKSVYTPDVLAVGEGPDTWGPYFTQQWRWAGGAFDTWRKMFKMVFFKTRPRVALHYLMILTYYPIAALTWLLAIASSVIYLTTGATAVIAPWGEFLSLYLMSLVMQLSLYFWNRRYNVSPHEPIGSYGVAGMAISSLVAPIYLSALWGIARGKKPNFVVTAKGGSENLDRLPAFRTHLQWAALLGICLAYGTRHGHDHPAMLIWVACLFIVCFLPLTLASILILRTKVASFIKEDLTIKGDSLNA